MIKKLERYSIGAVVLHWMKSSFSNRQQFESIGDFYSSCLDILCGVPHGSVLRSELFILYINDFCKVSKVLKFILLADDMNIFCEGKNLQHFMEEITSELNKTKKWFDINKLSLNLDKIKFILLGNRMGNNDSKVTIEGINIEKVN